MAFTDHCSIFASVNEEGINRVARHIMRQRPSLFNYATAFFRERPKLLCVPIDYAPEVKKAGNPLFAVQDPIPVPGTPTPVGLNWSLQFTKLAIDFHPGNAIALPPELGALAPQRLALRAAACVGLDCPPDGVINELIPRLEALNAASPDKPFTGIALPPRQPKETLVLPTRELLCFCLEVYAVAHVEWGPIGDDEEPWLKVRLDGLEIVDLRPQPMEDLIECYVKTVLRLGILPRLATPMSAMILNITEMLQDKGLDLGKKVTLQPTPISADAPHNPAVEQDQLKAFINLVVEEV
ncbi:MAG: hypothetical protein GXY76_06455 [Chloroflexi bacterium]|nr:hypothetical protein [Chloroflexota bacterium]